MSVVLEYIDRLEAALAEGRCDDYLIEDTVSTFSDLDGIKSGLDRYRSRAIAVGSKVAYDNLGDARKLRDKLRRYAEDRGMRQNGSAGERAASAEVAGLRALRDEATRLLSGANSQTVVSPEFTAWRARVSHFLDEHPRLAMGYRDRIESISFATEYCGAEDIAPPHATEDFRLGMSAAIACLDAMLDDCSDEFCRPESVTGSDSANANDSSRVFIVHGRNDAARLEVKMLLEKQGIEPVVLFEQANGGMTIIEKLEAHSDVRAAILLMTADDEGRLRDSGELCHRARQNVVFEAGMFIGRLGRKHVALLVDADVELPSDILGIGYISHEDGWQLELLKELRGMGFDVDANKLIG